MKELDVKSAIKILNTIMEYELAGVVRYTHYSLMVTGPYRIPLVDFFKAQASESLTMLNKQERSLQGLMVVILASKLLLLKKVITTQQRILYKKA